MHDEDALHAAIKAIYDAALDDTHWETALNHVLTATRSQAATFCVIDNRADTLNPDDNRLVDDTVIGKHIPAFFSYINFDKSTIDAYLDHMVQYDPTVRAILRTPGQKLFHDSALISEAEKNTHIYYDWHARQTDTWFRLAGIYAPEPSLHSGITIHQTRRQGDYSKSQIRIFQLLQDHLDRALRLSFRLGSLGKYSQLTTAVLDQNSRGIVIFDQQSRPIFMNTAARVIAQDRDGIEITGTGIRMIRQSDNARFQAAAEQAIHLHRQQTLFGSPALAILRPSGKRPYNLFICPLPRDAGTNALQDLAVSGPALCVILSDPEKHPHLPKDQLQSLYGLTASESRLAASLAKGQDLKECAQSLSISYETARTQLAAIFRKTETSRQAELVGLLLRTASLLETGE